MININSLTDKQFKEICDKWISNKTINPLTNKRIKEYGPTYRYFQELCSQGLADELFKNRVSADMNTRINYYLIVKDYIDKIKLQNNNNCVKFYKLVDNSIQYSIGKNIILTERLGKGSYGVVYKAYFRPSNIIKREYGKQFNLVIKICEITQHNKLEIEILFKLSQLIIKQICPHFPMCYGYFICHKALESLDNITKLTSAESSSVLNNRSYFTSSFDDNTNFIDKPNIYLQINEYANNSTLSKIINGLHIDACINTIIQSFISIAFFQKYINMAHRDTHGNNFLCHTIKPGGYFHYRIYNENYYLENIGYLIVINDFGLVKDLNEFTLLYDFKKFVIWFNKHKSSRSEFYIIKNFMRQLIIRGYNNVNSFYKYLFKFINSAFPQYLLTSKPIGPIIINKDPYIIE
jgi:serine/threonine protein kinase